MGDNSHCLGPPDDVFFRRGPSRWGWLPMALVAAVMFGICVACFPPNSGKKIAATLACLVVGSVFTTHGVRAFRERDHSHCFFGNRVEVYRRGKVLRRLPYADVRRLGYGFRADNPANQYLWFSGPGGEPFVRIDTSSARPAGAGELDADKLVAVRDVLNNVVASHMLAGAATPEGAEWFGNLRLTRRGVVAGTRLVPWTHVTIIDNQSTGSLLVSDAEGNELGNTSMVEGNVVPGLMVARQIQGTSDRS